MYVILLLWLLKSYALCVLTYGVFCKNDRKLFQKHEF